MRNKKHSLNTKITSLVLSVLVLFTSLIFPSYKVKADVVQSWGPFTSGGSFHVPVSGMYRLHVYGAAGKGWNPGYYSPSQGGLGGYATGEVYLVGGTFLYYNMPGDGGYGGSAGQSGGSSTDFRYGGNSQVNRILVAGGGGGGSSGYGSNGGGGGGYIAYNGDMFCGYAGGKGGNQSAGGAAGGNDSTGGIDGGTLYGIYGAILGYSGHSGSLGQGASSKVFGIHVSGAGGGGYYGGGSGAVEAGNDNPGEAGGGGGGSSFTAGTLSNASTQAGVSLACSADISLLSDTTPPTFPTVSANITGWTNQNVILTPYSTDASGIAKYEMYDSKDIQYLSTSTFTISTEGTNTYSFGAFDTAGNESGSTNYTTKIDKTNVISTYYEIKNKSITGYDVYIYGVADPLNSSNGTTGSGVNRVQFPTWTTYNDIDDIQSSWQTNPTATGVNEGGGTWYYRVNTTDHKNETGNYNTNIYGYDNAGNSICLASLTASIISTPQLIITIPQNNIIYSN